MLSKLKGNLNNWNNAYQIFINSSFKRWVAPKTSNPFKEEAKAIRDKVKEKCKKKLEGYRFKEIQFRGDEN